MKILLTSWTDNLFNLFTQEVELYSELYALEVEKSDAIIQADGKRIEFLAKKSYELMVAASEIERARLNSINEIYEKASLERKTEIPTLNDFLNQIDRDSNFKLKGITNSLRESVNQLKDKILSNERLLASRKELFQKTLQALTNTKEDTLYQADHNRNKQKPAPLMVNTRA